MGLKGQPKTGGRTAGTPNKPKAEVIPPGSAEAIMQDEKARLDATLALAATGVRTPKAVMLDAMVRFENLGLGFLDKAEKMMKTRAGVAKIAEAAHEGHKFIVAAVECATKAAPYVHARLLAVEARGDMTEDKAPYVLRVPAVMPNSAAWQQAVGAMVAEQLASQPPGQADPTTLRHPALPQPAQPEPEPPPAPVVLTADSKGKISTVMPPGPRTVQPSGSQEWLDGINAARKAG